MRLSIRRLFRGLYRLCACGCGTFIHIIDKKSRLRNYAYHHQPMSGNNNGQWKGGVTESDKGYLSSKERDHPNCNQQGYVMQHRLIYEHYLKILFDEDVYIPRNYDIHHINGIKDDNSLINLELLTRAEHISKHKKGIKKDMSNRTCLSCGSDKTWINKKGINQWYKNKDGFVCSKCYWKIKYISNKNKGC